MPDQGDQQRPNLIIDAKGTTEVVPPPAPETPVVSPAIEKSEAITGPRSFKEMDIFELDRESRELTKGKEGLGGADINDEDQVRLNEIEDEIVRRLQRATENGTMEKVIDEIELLQLEATGYAEEVQDGGKPNNTKKAEILRGIKIYEEEKEEQYEKEKLAWKKQQEEGKANAAGGVEIEDVGMSYFLIRNGIKTDGGRVPSVSEIKKAVREVKPPEKKAEETPVQKEFDPKRASWMDLWIKARQEEDPEERKRLFESVNQRIKEAEDKRLINKKGMKENIIRIFRDGTWQEGHPDYIGTLFTQLADSAENEANAHSDYRNKPEYEGMARELVLTVADRVVLMGIFKAESEIRKKISDNLQATVGSVDINEVDRQYRLWLSQKLMTAPEKVNERLDGLNRTNTDEVQQMMYIPNFELLVQGIPSKGKMTGEEAYELGGGKGAVTSNEIAEALKQLPEQQAEQIHLSSQLRFEEIQAIETQTEIMKQQIETYTALEASLGAEINMSREIDTWIKKEGKNTAIRRIRDIMNQIESSPYDWSSNEALAKKLMRLENSLPIMEQALGREVRDEIKTRISVYDSSRLMRRANGWIGENPARDINISQAVTTAKVRKHMVGEEERAFFLGGDYQRKCKAFRFQDRNEAAFRNPNGENINLEILMLGKNQSLSMSEGITMAFDWLEKINSDKYRDVVALIDSVYHGSSGDLGQNVDAAQKQLYTKKRINGEDIFIPNVVNFFLDGDNERRDKVKKFVVAAMSGTGYSSKERKTYFDSLVSSGMTNEDAKKAIIGRIEFAEKCISLAENLALSTLETSRWNVSTSGGRLFTNDENIGANDEPSEIFYFRNWRMKRECRNRGMEASIPTIPGWGTSFLGKEVRYPDENDGGKMKKAVVENSKYDMLSDYNNGPRQIRSNLLSNGFEGALDGYSNVTLMRWNELKKLMATESFDPKEVATIELFKKAFVYFTTAESSLSKERLTDMDLRSWFIFNVKWYAKSEEGSRIWAPEVNGIFDNIVSNTDMSTFEDEIGAADEVNYGEKKKKRTFITYERLNEINTLADPYGFSGFINTFAPLHRQVNQNFFATLFGGGGGKRK